MPFRIPTALELSAGMAAAGVAATLAYGIIAPESQIFGQTLVGPRNPDELSLTFDDGPNPTATPKLLEVLAKRRVRATFFLIGAFARREPGLTREIAAAGHLIGNHTMTHRFLPRLSSARIHTEIAECSAVLEDILGRAVTLFRPPHGGRSPSVFRAAGAAGLTTVQWNVIVGDWQSVSAETILARLERGIERNRAGGRGTNIVLHDGGQARLGMPRLKTVEAVENLLARLNPATRFVTPQPGLPGKWA